LEASKVLSILYTDPSRYQLTAPRDLLTIGLSGVTLQQGGQTPVSDLAAAKTKLDQRRETRADGSRG